MKYTVDEINTLNKRIEELEKANNELTEQNRILTDNVNYHNECRLALADMIRAIKYAICSRVCDKRVNYISYMTDKIKDDEIFNRPELKTAKNDIPKICKHLTAHSTDSLNKRIEGLEKANYDLGIKSVAYGNTANRLHEENDILKNKVESIKKEARNWKALYENADSDRLELKNVIDIIYNDFKSATACDDLKGTLNALPHNSGLDHISMPTKVGYILDKGNCLTAKDEVRVIIDQIITIMESRELNQNVVFSAEDDLHIARGLAADIIAICEADDKFEVTLKKFSQLYEAINAIHDCDNDSILYAFKSVLLIFSKVNSNLENVVSENVVWKNKAQKAEKALNDQKKMNDANKATIAQMVIEKRAMDKELSDAADALKEVNDKNEGLTNMLKEITNCVADIMYVTRGRDYDVMISKLTDISRKIGVKTSDDGPIYGISVISNTLIRIIKEGNNDAITAKEFKELFSIRNSLAEVIYAIRNAIYNNDTDAFRCIENRMKFDRDFNSDPFMAGVRENIKDICAAEKRNIANYELKNSEIARLSNEKNQALERAEKFKGIANSVYGMTIPGRCNGKQMFCDITTGKKILINKEKYDDLMECVNNISLTYEIMKLTPFSMDRPSWLSGIINRINDLTK